MVSSVLFCSASEFRQLVYVCQRLRRSSLGHVDSGCGVFMRASILEKDDVGCNAFINSLFA